MSYHKKILILASSRKTSGRCVAGRELRGSTEWIRPVSSRPTAEVSLDERRYEDGQDPQLLDVVRIQFKSAEPKEHQVENHVIDADFYWQKVRQGTWDEAVQCVDNNVPSLWGVGSSTYYGRNDRVPEHGLNSHQHSLRLIGPLNVTLKVVKEGEEFGNGKRRVRAEFVFKGDMYDIVVTDPKVETEFLAKANGSYEIGQVLLCVSLSEPWSGFAYKLVAGIIRP